jgi:hypothetical protein
MHEPFNLFMDVNKCFLDGIDKVVNKNVGIMDIFNLTLFKTSEMPAANSVRKSDKSNFCLWFPHTNLPLIHTHHSH